MLNAAVKTRNPFIKNSVPAPVRPRRKKWKEFSSAEQDNQSRILRRFLYCNEIIPHAKAIVATTCDIKKILIDNLTRLIGDDVK